MISKKKIFQSIIKLFISCILLYVSVLYIGPFIAGIVSNITNSGNNIEVKKTVITPSLQNPISTTNKDRVSLNGIASNNVIVELFLNGDSYGKLSTDNDGKFEFQDVEILKGKNKLYLIARNKEGIESPKSRDYEIDFDDKKPSIINLNVKNGEEVKNLNKNILIKGEVSEPSNIEINSKKVFKVTDNKFEYLLGVEEGDFEVKIKITDKAGNEYLETLIIKYKKG